MGTNLGYEFECLGYPTEEELTPLIEKIEAEGHSFVLAPSLPNYNILREIMNKSPDA